MGACFFARNFLYTFVVPVIISGTVVATAVLFISIQPYNGQFKTSERLSQGPDKSYRGGSGEGIGRGA